MSKPV